MTPRHKSMSFLAQVSFREKLSFPRVWYCSVVFSGFKSRLNSMHHSIQGNFHQQPANRIRKFADSKLKLLEQNVQPTQEFTFT